jgi:S1-C subfamily serine protease
MRQMGRMLWIAAVLVLALTGNGFSRTKTLEKPLGDITKDQVIDRCFKGKVLDPVEGIWLEDDNVYEIAIVKNTYGICPGYDYVGIITDTTTSEYKKGELKTALKKLSSDSVLTGIWYLRDKSQGGTTFTVTEGDVLDGKMSSDGGELANPRCRLIRVYPRTGSGAGTNSSASPVVFSGTGFAITREVVVTNYHVIADSKKVTLTTSNGTKLAGVVIAKDPSNDVALIRTSDLPQTVEPLPVGSPRSTRSGSKVFTIGFPLPDELGTQAKVSEGIINSTTGIEDDPRMFQISIPVQPGNSGGPLLNTKGQVVGIVTSGLSNVYLFVQKATLSQNVNFAMKVNYIDNLLGVLPGDITLADKPSDRDLDASQIMSAARDAVVLVTSVR